MGQLMHRAIRSIGTDNAWLNWKNMQICIPTRKCTCNWILSLLIPISYCNTFISASSSASVGDDLNSLEDSEEFSLPPVPPSPSTPSQSINDSLRKRFPVDTLNIKGNGIPSFSFSFYWFTETFFLRIITLKVHYVFEWWQKRGWGRRRLLK